MNHTNASRVPTGAASKRRRRYRHVGRGWLCGAAVFALATFMRSSAQGTEAEAVAIEAAMLRNFARYVSWPTAAFATEAAPWRICVFGSDPFKTILERTIVSRQEQGRGFAIQRATDPAELTACHVIYIAAMDGQRRHAALATWRNLPILTVSEAPDFLQEGGTIRFDVGERVELSVNLDQARALGLRIQTKLLEVAREVVDSGSIRRRR